MLRYQSVFGPRRVRAYFRPLCSLNSIAVRLGRPLLRPVVVIIIRWRPIAGPRPSRHIRMGAFRNAFRIGLVELGRTNDGSGIPGSGRDPDLSTGAAITGYSNTLGASKGLSPMVAVVVAVFIS